LQAPFNRKKEKSGGGCMNNVKLKTFHQKSAKG